MENDKLAWLCSELGLAAVVESERGVLVNRAAQAAGCGVCPPALEMAVCALTRLHELPANVVDAIQSARSGGSSVALIASNGVGQVAYRVVATCARLGYAQVVVAPQGVDMAFELSRRASLVDVAAAVSHEVANAVGAIAGWAQLATSGSGVSHEEALRLIASCARTAQEAARSMLALARGEQVPEGGETALSELTDELLSLLSLTARQERVSLSGHIEADLCAAGTRAQFFTVLWNLTKNAIEACRPPGAVSVSLRGQGPRIVLEVTDNGPGLDPAQLSRIFTPYYTTKATGTGLGLPLVQKTVADLHGELSVHAARPRGSVFRVTFPRLQRASRVGMRHDSEPASGLAPLPKALAAQESGLDARILVVDDDDALREMVRTALSLRGAQVVTARSADEARAAEGRFDIALIDMTLEGARGDELLATLRRRGSVAAAMLVTGTVQKPRLVPGGEPDDWVRKPFEISQLVERIQRTLERHRMLNSVSANGRR